jgi:hypothetical protein
MRGRVRPWADPEAGSLVVALAVMLVLTTLSLTLLARTVSGLLSARKGQDVANASAAARAGLDDALFALNSQAVGASAPAAVPPTGQSAQQGSLPDGATFAWRATLDAGTGNYTVLSTGTENGVTHTLGASTVRGPRFPYALFADHGITINGTTARAGRIIGSGLQAPIGSNGDIVLADGAGGGDSQVPYPPAGACSGCPLPKPAAAGPLVLRQPDITNPIDTAPDAPPSTPYPCPGVIDGTLAPVTVPGGVYLCDGQDLTLKGTVVPPSSGSAAVIFLTNGASLHLQSLAMSAGDPTEFVVNVAGQGGVDATGVNSLTGLLYAPSAGLIVPGCNLAVSGALTLGSFSCDGDSSSTFGVSYSLSAASLTESWTLTGIHDQPTPASL